VDRRAIDETRRETTMNVALKAANDLFVCAEEGGGIDTRDAGSPVAVRANRPQANAWETFTVEFLDHGRIALKTCNGYYVTAELGGGGALRTNERERGPWEEFTPLGSWESGYGLRTADGHHFLCAEIESPDPVVNATRTEQFAWETFQAVLLEADVDIKRWTGATCIPDALPGIPYGDHERIWTPAYGCYDDHWRARIRAAYRERPYTHFVYNCVGLPYANDYPELPDDPARVARDLDELDRDGLVPVVVATDDRKHGELARSFVANGARVRVCFPMWEMNGVLHDDLAAMESCILATLRAAPQADCYLHFTPGHGSINRDEAAGWHWCQDHGTTGLLAQGANRFPPEDPVTGGKGLDSTAIRLLGRVDLGAPPAWAGLHQLTVKFEYGVFAVYHGDVSEQDQRAYTAAFLAHAPHVVGFCDGGPSADRAVAASAVGDLVRDGRLRPLHGREREGFSRA